MALNKPALEAAIAAAFNGVKDFDGTPGKTQADAIAQISADIATAVDTYTSAATVVILQSDIVTAALSNAAGPVVAANILNGTLN